MKILLCTVPFAPAIGGIETVSELLAERFSRQGHEVTVLTRTRAEEFPARPYRILRDPGPLTLARAVAHADVVFHNNISLRFAWPLLLHPRKPWVIAHHTWLPTEGRHGIAGRLKHAVLGRARHIVPSAALGAALNVPFTFIPNPYADDVFGLRPDVTRSRDLVFLGRLVSDKGLAVLLEALAQLRDRAVMRRLTVIGEGADGAALHALSMRLGLQTQVEFRGSVRGEALVRLLNEHREIVIPSVWEEPFGLVALEAIACGLVPIASRSGGLPDAVGPCGILVTKGDVAALARALETPLDGDQIAVFQGLAVGHLAKHTPEHVANAYLEVLTAAAAR